MSTEVLVRRMLGLLPTIDLGDNFVTLLANDDLDVEIVSMRTIEEHAAFLQQIVSVFPKRIAKSKWISTLERYRRTRGWAIDSRWTRDEAHKIVLCTAWVRANARRTPHGGHTQGVIDVKKAYLAALEENDSSDEMEDGEVRDADLEGSSEDGEDDEDGEVGEVGDADLEGYAEDGDSEVGPGDELEEADADPEEEADAEEGEEGEEETDADPDDECSMHGDEENEEDEVEADASVAAARRLQKRDSHVSVRSEASLHSEPAASAAAYVAAARPLQKRDSHVSICSSDPGQAATPLDLKDGENYDPVQHRAIIKSKRKGLLKKPAAAGAVIKSKRKGTAKKPAAIEEVSAEKEPTGPVVRAEIERLLPLAGSPQPQYAAGPQVVCQKKVEYGKTIFQIRNKTQNEVIQITLRNYPGIFLLAGHVLERLMHEGYSKEQLSVVKIVMLENPP